MSAVAEESIAQAAREARRSAEALVAPGGGQAQPISAERMDELMELQSWTTGAGATVASAPAETELRADAEANARQCIIMRGLP